MITDPRGIDFAHYRELGQEEWMAELEQRAIDAFRALGILMTDTCIHYQTIMPPARGERHAFGDTGVVIYCNSVLGAYSNFEGGFSALAADLTVRVPCYGPHLDENRRAIKRFRLGIPAPESGGVGRIGSTGGQTHGVIPGCARN